MAYEQAGNGPPLVLLHGYVGDGRATWRYQLDELSDEFTVLAWDGPGMGSSADPPPEFRLADYADRLADFVDVLDLGRPHVAGISFGGALALELYRRHPDVPRTLVLASAYAGWAGSLPPDETELRLRQVLELADRPPAEFVEAIRPTLFSDSTPVETIDAFVANASGFHPAGLRTMARSVAEADLRDMLPRIAVPTLLLYGDRDVRAPLYGRRATPRGDSRLPAGRAPRRRARRQPRGTRALQRRGQGISERAPMKHAGLSRAGRDTTPRHA